MWKQFFLAKKKLLLSDFIKKLYCELSFLVKYRATNEGFWSKFKEFLGIFKFLGFYRKLRSILRFFDQISDHFSWNSRPHRPNSVEFHLIFYFLHFPHSENNKIPGASLHLVPRAPKNTRKIQNWHDTRMFFQFFPSKRRDEKQFVISLKKFYYFIFKFDFPPTNFSNFSIILSRGKKFFFRTYKTCDVRNNCI